MCLVLTATTIAVGVKQYVSSKGKKSKSKRVGDSDADSSVSSSKREANAAADVSVSSSNRSPKK